MSRMDPVWSSIMNGLTRSAQTEWLNEVKPTLDRWKTQHAASAAAMDPAMHKWWGDWIASAEQYVSSQPIAVPAPGMSTTMATPQQ